MSVLRRSVPTPTMTLAEAAEVLGIESALAHRLAEDGAFPVVVLGGGPSSRVPAREVAVLSRILRPARVTRAPA